MRLERTEQGQEAGLVPPTDRQRTQPQPIHTAGAVRRGFGTGLLLLALADHKSNSCLTNQPLTSLRLSLRHLSPPYLLAFLAFLASANP